ncbi:MAG: PQQ-like beta-propeller repeat protein, partial [Phycisphaerae bacterium]|nr:PQQ-like beta-propeller repeat protein [Phycisphaerae bacterium]
FDTSNGDVIWVYNTGPYEIRCMSPAITDDGAVVVGTLGGKLFAFKDE